MSLYQITPNQLPDVWQEVAPLLQKAIDLEPDALTIEQVEYFIRTGKTYLIIWEEDKVITGASIVDFIDYPTYRVGHINLLGGKDVVKEEVFQETKKWIKYMGATKVQCWARGALVKMYQKIGFENTHQVMRINL
jgi:hypothetical protein